MKHLSRKIKNALAILFVCLIAFIGFSKAGILFSDNGGDVITVSTTKKTFDPNNFVASMARNNTISTTISTTTSATTSVKTTVTTTTAPATCSTWSGDKLTKSKGVVQGPTGKETYYNLNMDGVISAMRTLGYSEEDYPYWVREDGVKMLGQYVMIAANYSIYPKGTTDVLTSLGCGIVCDTGSFVNENATQLDIAVTWR